MLFKAKHSGRLALMLAAWCSQWIAPLLNAQNLIPNSSFEEIELCPDQQPVLGFENGRRPDHWFSVMPTPDYFNSCEDEQVTVPPITSVPHNPFTFQYPQDGQAYSGMWTHESSNYRELIGAELVAPLVVGQIYYGSFWANAAFGGNSTVFAAGANNNIGMLFTMEAEEWLPVFGTPFGLRNFAQIKSDSVIADTLGWTLVSGSFVADSAYRFVVVGNHFDDNHTLLQTLQSPDSLLPWLDSTSAYVLVDNFCLSTNQLGCPLVTGVLEIMEPFFQLAPNPCDHELSILFNGPLPEAVFVGDQLGRKVWASTAISTGQLTIPVADLAEGLYYVQVISKGVRHSDNFVVKH